MIAHPTTVLGWVILLLSIGFPYVSAAVTARAGHLAGILTAVLAAADGIVNDLATKDHLTWHAAQLALGAWLLAGGWHVLVSAGDAENALHGIGPQLGKKHPSPHPHPANG